MVEQIRIDITIPLRDNNGVLIKPEEHKKTKDELTQRFGGCTFLTTSEGAWKDFSDSERLYLDINTSCFVVTSNTAETIEFFRKYKKTLEDRYKQEKIFMVYHPVAEI